MTSNDNPEADPILDSTSWLAHEREFEKLCESVRPANKTGVFDALDAAGIATVVISFDGYGDSGQIEKVEVDGFTTVLPDVKVDFTTVGAAKAELEARAIPLHEVLENIVYDLLCHRHGGWQDNEGSYGDVTFDATVRTITLDFNERYVGSNNFTYSY